MLTTSHSPQNLPLLAKGDDGEKERNRFTPTLPLPRQERGRLFFSIMGMRVLGKVKLPAYRAGPFDKAHGSELVEELPGHAVASRMRAKEISFILCPPWSGLIDLTPRDTFRPDTEENL